MDPDELIDGFVDSLRLSFWERGLWRRVLRLLVRFAGEHVRVEIFGVPLTIRLGRE